MFIYILYCSVLCFILLIGAHKVVISQLQIKYQRWRSLNSLVSTQHRTAWSVFYHSLRILCTLLYQSFIQYMNTTVVRLGRNKFKVNYLLHGKMYTMIVTPIRGPAPVLQIINDIGDDVTDDVLPYMGPKYDWHGTNLDFLSTFGSKELTFNLDSGDVITCSESKKFLH